MAGRGPQTPFCTLVLTVPCSLQGPRVSKDSWATRGPLGPWVTEAPKDPKETKDSQVSGAPQSQWGDSADLSLSGMCPYSLKGREKSQVGFQRSQDLGGRWVLSGQCEGTFQVCSHVPSGWASERRSRCGHRGNARQLPVPDTMVSL